MLQQIRLTVLIKILCFVLLVFGDDCSKYDQWCSHKSGHIMCASSSDSVFSDALKTNITEFSSYYKRTKEVDYCSRINNKNTNISEDGNLSDMALKSLKHHLFQLDICYATRAGIKVIVIYGKKDLTQKPRWYASNPLTDLPHIKSFQDISVGCANHSMGVLCLLSGRDQFIKFSNFVPLYKRKCGLDYSELNCKICYLNDATVKSILVGMRKFVNKHLEWSERLEYLAHLRAIFAHRRPTKLCNSDKSIDVQIETTDYNITTIAKYINQNRNFDVLANETKCNIGCAVSDLKRNSFRLLCLYNNEEIREEVRDECCALQELQNIFGLKCYHAWFLYLCLVLVYFNIFTISIYLTILLKFIRRREPTMEELYEMHEYSYIGLFPPQYGIRATQTVH